MVISLKQQERKLSMKARWIISLTIFPKQTFIPEGVSDPKYYSMLVASLTVICDRLLAFTGFLSAHLGKYFRPCLVEVTLNGFYPIFERTVFLSCENLPVFVRYSQKQFAKLCLPVILAGLWTLITNAGHTTR